MEKNAVEYGLDGISMEPPLEYDSVEMAAPTSLALVADITDTATAELAALNPSLLKGIAPPSFSLHVPKGSGNQLSATLQSIPAEHRAAWRMHRVGLGETLASIGKRYGVSTSSIVTANSLHSDEALEGDRLVIPAVQHAQAAPPARRPAAHAPARRTTKATTTASVHKPAVIVARSK
jgi:LysM repeat protein